MIIMYCSRNYRFNFINHLLAFIVKKKLVKAGYEMYDWPEQKSFFNDENISSRTRLGESIIEINSAFKHGSYDALLINTDNMKMLSAHVTNNRATMEHSTWKKLLNNSCEMKFERSKDLFIFLNVNKGKLLAKKIGI